MSEFTTITAREVILKHPAEELERGLDFVDVLHGGTIQSVLSATLVQLAGDADPALAVANPAFAGRVATFTLTGGKAGQDWLLTVLLQLVGEQKVAGCIQVKVRDR